MKFSICSIPKELLPAALTIPTVIESFNPIGFPNAIDHWPICTLSESANSSGLNFSFDWIFNTAISTSGDVPTSFVLYSLPSENFTKISSAPSITWLFVTTYPFSDTTNPDPKAPDSLVSWRFPEVPNNNSSSGL